MPSFFKIAALMTLAVASVSAAPIDQSSVASTSTNSTLEADWLNESYDAPEDMLDDLEDESALQKRGKKYTGKGTWFQPGRGNCGGWNKASDSIIALPTSQYSGGKHCYKWAQVCSGSKCVNAQVVDSCPSCGYGSLDMSPRAFTALAPKSKGVINVKWQFL